MKKILLLTTVTLVLSACGGRVALPIKGQAGLSALAQTKQDSKPSEQDYALSCEELSDRLTRLDARYQELYEASEKKRKKKALISGVANTAFSIFASQQSVQSLDLDGGNLQEIAAVTNVTQAGMNHLIDGNDSDETLKSMTEIQPIASRMIALNRVKTEKCTEK